jgi:hypothetical protein
MGTTEASVTAVATVSRSGLPGILVGMLVTLPTTKPALVIVVLAFALGVPTC